MCSEGQELQAFAILVQTGKDRYIDVPGCQKWEII